MQRVRLLPRPLMRKWFMMMKVVVMRTDLRLCPYRYHRSQIFAESDFQFGLPHFCAETSIAGQSRLAAPRCPRPGCRGFFLTSVPISIGIPTCIESINHCLKVRSRNLFTQQLISIMVFPWHYSVRKPSRSKVNTSLSPTPARGERCSFS